MSYKVGSGVVAGEETVVLESRGFHLDLNKLLLDPVASGGAEFPDAPVSLTQMMEAWAFWERELPGLVARAFEGRSGGGPAAEIDGDEIRWLPPLRYPRKLICVGTNYKDHIAEMGIEALPKHPYSFFKPATTTLLGSGEAVALPEQAEMVDWEAELAVVIGRRVRSVRGEEAIAAVAGYCVLNDVSARDWIAEPTLVGVDWVMQKAFDGFTPMGPFITPARFVPDPQELAIRLSVNGETKQNSTTANMVFSVREIVEHLAAIMTLEPGDVIATGTPAGVGYGMRPQQFLKPGDRMTVEIEGLGTLETPVK